MWHICLVFIILFLPGFFFYFFFSLIHFSCLLRNFDNLCQHYFCSNQVNSNVSSFTFYIHRIALHCKAANLSEVTIPIRMNQYVCACMHACVSIFAWCQSQSDRKLQQQQQQRRTADLIAVTALLEALRQVKYRNVLSS